jgi:hypothetical protein
LPKFSPISFRGTSRGILQIPSFSSLRLVLIRPSTFLSLFFLLRFFLFALLPIIILCGLHLLSIPLEGPLISPSISYDSLSRG